MQQLTFFILKMANNLRHPGYAQYETRLEHLFKEYEKVDDIAEQAHKAKYLAVLVSGYLEQAVKELLLNYSHQRSDNDIYRYVDKTWPKSMGMDVRNIETILDRFNSSWSKDFELWVTERIERKERINSLVSWRNRIAHGQESRTTGVTMHSVKNAFTTASDLVAFIHGKVK